MHSGDKQQSAHPMSLLLQVTGKSGIVVRGQRNIQIGKLNSKSWQKSGNSCTQLVSRLDMKVASVSPKLAQSIGLEQPANRTEGG